MTCADCEYLQSELAANPSPPAAPVGKRVALAAAIVAGGVAVATTAIALPFVTPAFRRTCLPYVPATSQQIDNVLAALRRVVASTGDAASTSPLIDVGSGDGRVVMAAATRGGVASAAGVELNRPLVMYARWQAWRSGLAADGRVAFHHTDLWAADVAPYRTVVVFGVEQMMAALQAKLTTECRRDADVHVVACRFPFVISDSEAGDRRWQHVATHGEGVDAVWLYRISGG